MARGVKRTENPIIECACGCGKTLHKYDRFGHLRRYVYQHQPRSKGLKHNFEKYVVKTEDGCWEWNACKSPFGYGLVSDGNNRTIAAHRASYTIYKGEIPDGMNVLHKCDNPECTNPDHLFLGTQADNIHDAQSKGRLRSCIKIERESVNEMRELHATGRYTQQTLADMFHCSRAQVGRIVNNQLRLNV